MSEDKILKFPANQEVEVRLKSTKPFWTGTDKYEKKRYGYELHNEISGKEKFYCSETCHELIQASGVQKLDLFKMMLKNENNKSIWLLSRDGKEWLNKFQFQDNNENNIRNNDNESNNLPESIPAASSNDRSDISSEIQNLKNEMIAALESFKVRIDILEKRVAAQEKPEPLSESEIPF
tara:strand:- start:10406 stop:10942 length:537 start_codon:yes stop_codon:yes gene_type:complete